MDILERVRRFAGRRVLVALSGGADSVALLLLARDAGCDVSAAHFEHGIRGAESLEDAAFCRRLCLELGVPYFEGSADVPGRRAPGEGIETAARRLRYAFLEKARVEAGAEVIALAHHMDDQAETVLMHMLRGAGTDGASGMREQSGNLIRPLLFVRKAEILEYLQRRGQPYRTDRTNAEPTAPRNRLRLEAMPILEDIYPNAVGSIARYAAIASDEGALLDDLADKWTRDKTDESLYFRRLRVKELPHPAILRRALRRILPFEADSETVFALEKLCASPRGAMALPGGLRAERAGEHLYLLHGEQNRPEPVPIAIPGITRLRSLCEISAELCEPVPSRGDPCCQVLSLDALSGAVLRTRRNGDRIRPLGMAGSKLLSDYMIDRKLDRPLRDSAPLVAVKENILWAVGLGISEDAKAVNGAKAVRLTCRALS
ncbi:MAG: tRNA lysidine(34) synthetase TilS [Clostridiales bacterium]|nr:tRNA lysidine(34) synthetase TilS [Clostridiales bacterium]